MFDKGKMFTIEKCNPEWLHIRSGLAFRLLGEREPEELGRGLDSWWSVARFARTLSGTAWRDGLIGDRVIPRWARSREGEPARKDRSWPPPKARPGKDRR